MNFNQALALVVNVPILGLQPVWLLLVETFVLGLFVWFVVENGILPDWISLWLSTRRGFWITMALIFTVVLCLLLLNIILGVISAVMLTLSHLQWAPWLGPILLVAIVLFGMSWFVLRRYYRIRWPF